MAAPRQAEPEGAKAALIAFLEERFGTAMGVRLTVLEKLVRGGDAVALAAAWLLLYGAAAGLVVWWANEWPLREVAPARLAGILAWNWLHFAVLIAITRLLTLRVLDIVRRDILPFASDDYAACVAAAIARDHASPVFRFAPCAVAALALAASLWALRSEIDPIWWNRRPFPADLLFWSATAFFLSVLYMRVMVTITFPRAFAAALDRDRDHLYPLCAAESPLVAGLARLNRTLLVYTVLVFLVLATILLLALVPPPFRLLEDSTYLFTVIPLLGFFSLGFGTLVYLGSEFDIAVTLRRFSLERAELLQRKISPLLDSAGDEAAAARLERLTRLHDRIVAGGRYGSRFGKAVSITLPLALPLIGLIDKLVEKLAGSAANSAAAANPPSLP